MSLDEWTTTDDDVEVVVDSDTFDYDNPPYVPLTTFNASLVRFAGDMKSGGLLLTFRVDATDKDLALAVSDYPQQELRLAIERVDYPELVEQEPGDADGEWGNVNYPDGGWRGGRKVDQIDAG